MWIFWIRRSCVRDVSTGRCMWDVRMSAEERRFLHVHAKNKPLGDDVDLKQIAQTTAGFTGADLENLLNEAAIIAAKEDRAYITQTDIKKAFVKVGIGAEKKSRVISEKEKRITALPRIRSCDPVPSASGCRSGLFRIDHSDGSGSCRLHDAAAGA